MNKFLSECIIVDPNSTTSLMHMFLAYRHWASESGLIPVGKIQFAVFLEGQGFKKARINAAWVWKGIALKRIV